MGKLYETITEELANWIEKRELFFVATAPLSADGLINCSPKGLDSFRIINPTTVAYADFTGSGIETAAHLKENGRIVIMFCAFSGPPLIVRLHGNGTFVDMRSEEFSTLSERFPNQPGVRGYIKVDVSRISDSCGYGVPKFEYIGQRETLVKSIKNKGPEKLAQYRSDKNATRIDGLPGI
jgi:hypothetical protein